MAQAGLSCVVSTNYDVLVERALHRSNDNGGPTTPIFYYGGFMLPQAVHHMLDITAVDPRDRYRLVELGTEVPIYKLHGSVTWAWEHHSRTLKVHADVRAAYRGTDRMGRAAIIPPIPESELDPWFHETWRTARLDLADADEWVVCGYSMPPYDTEVRRLLVESLTNSNVTQIEIRDPASERLVSRWQEVLDEAGHSAQVRARHGL